MFLLHPICRKFSAPDWSIEYRRYLLFPPTTHEALSKIHLSMRQMHAGNQSLNFVIVRQPLVHRLSPAMDHNRSGSSPERIQSTRNIQRSGVNILRQTSCLEITMEKRNEDGGMYYYKFISQPSLHYYVASLHHPLVRHTAGRIDKQSVGDSGDAR